MTGRLAAGITKFATGRPPSLPWSSLFAELRIQLMTRRTQSCAPSGPHAIARPTDCTFRYRIPGQSRHGQHEGIRCIPAKPLEVLPIR